MAHRLVVLEWLYKADQDFGFVKANLDAKEVSYFDPLCFFSQQATEKYLKAYIIQFKLSFSKIHDLLKLLKICSQHDSTFSTLTESCQYLNPFYIETRYADDVFAIISKDQAVQALFHVEKIQKFVREKLGIVHEVTLEQVREEHKKLDEILK